MARDHRIMQDGKRQDYTCENQRFKTKTSDGPVQEAGAASRGSVLPKTLFERGDYSLRLEQVIDKSNNAEVYWLMWYKGGRPTIPLSGVFGEVDLKGIRDSISEVLGTLDLKG